MMQSAVRSLAASRLLFLTSLPALDGTLFVLGATGGLATPGAAVLAGLTVIAGANAWLAARDEFRRIDAPPARWRLLTIAAASTGLALLSAWGGGVVGAALELRVLPLAAGGALLVLGAGTAGLAHARRVSPGALLALGFVGEVARWSP